MLKFFSNQLMAAFAAAIAIMAFIGLAFCLHLIFGG